jgi:hypothetical protein
MASELEDVRRIMPTDHDAAIGKIARRWGELEHEIDWFTWTLAAVEPHLGACITSQVMSIYGKLNSVIALAQLNGVDEKLIKKLKTFQGGVSGLADRRNRAIHDARILNETGEICRLQVTTKPPIYGPQPETLADLAALAKDIRREYWRFREIREAIATGLLALPHRPKWQPPGKHYIPDD